MLGQIECSLLLKGYACRTRLFTPPLPSPREEENVINNNLFTSHCHSFSSSLVGQRTVLLGGGCFPLFGAEEGMVVSPDSGSRGGSTRCCVYMYARSYPPIQPNPHTPGAPHLTPSSSCVVLATSGRSGVILSARGPFPQVCFRCSPPIRIANARCPLNTKVAFLGLSRSRGASTTAPRWEGGMAQESYSPVRPHARI